MNKEQLEGYLLACCDDIDRMIKTGKLEEDDIAGKLSEFLREYIGLNQKESTWTWWHGSYPIYTDTINTKHCQYCGKLIGNNELHICNSAGEI